MSAQVLPLFEPPAHGNDAAGRLFDEVRALFAARSAAEAMSQLIQGLHELRRKLPAADWQSVKADWMQHPLACLVHQDPLTSWSYRRPRGYPGDAHLIDFICGEASAAADLAAASELGRAIHAVTSQSAMAVALRDRACVVADMVDRTAGKASGPITVLTLAPGHLREADRARSLADGRIARWVALDRDRDNLARIRDWFADTAVEAVDGSVKGLIAGRHDLGRFDLICAAGLFDYLAEPMARSLTDAAFRMLKPGGTLLFSNMARGIETDGYMDTFMDWPLAYRDGDELSRIWSDLPAEDIAVRWLFTDANQSVIYGIVQRT